MNLCSWFPDFPPISLEMLYLSFWYRCSPKIYCLVPKHSHSQGSHSFSGCQLTAWPKGVPSLSPDWLFLLKCGTYAHLVCVAHSHLRLSRPHTKLVLFTPNPLLTFCLWNVPLAQPGALMIVFLILPSFLPTTAIPSTSSVVVCSVITGIFYFSPSNCYCHLHSCGHHLLLASCNSLLWVFSLWILTPTNPDS